MTSPTPCPPGQHEMPDGTCMADDEMQEDFHLAGKHDQRSHAHRAAGGKAGAAARSKAMVRDYVGGRGKSLKQVADKHGVSPSTVHRTLVNAGVQLRPRGGSSRTGLLDPQQFSADVEDYDIIFDDFEDNGPILVDDPDMMEDTVQIGLETPWHAKAAIEGEWSGENRQIAPGALVWEGTLPFTLAWQPAEAPKHAGSVAVGRVDGVARVGRDVWAWGVFDASGINGAEALRLVDGGFVTSISATADDIEHLDVELVCPSPVEEDIPGEPTCPEPKMIIHHGRLRSLTLLNVAAFPDCRIQIGPPPPEVLTAAAIGAHSTETSTGAWDGPANEKRLPSPMSEATARAAYAWLDDGAIQDGQTTKAAARFLHHEVSADGSPGPANLTACSTGIGVLNGGRGGTIIPPDGKRGVWEHLAGHLRDADREPPPLEAATGPTTVTAAGYTITIPDVWPESWFDKPTEAPPFGALHVTAQGRVYGYLGPDRVAHRAFRASGRRVTIPRGIDYSEFLNKPCLVAGADGHTYRINAGNITMGCSHPSPDDPRRADPRWAIQQYDNTCSIVARVRVGEDDHGVWVAGALLHGIEPEAVERMMACALSGDWQNGRLNAALLVPVEGFPTPVQGTMRVREGAVVASMTPVRFAPDTPSADLRPVLERLARSINRDSASRMEQLAARINR